GNPVPTATQGRPDSGRQPSERSHQCLDAQGAKPTRGRVSRLRSCPRGPLRPHRPHRPRSGRSAPNLHTSGETLADRVFILAGMPSGEVASARSVVIIEDEAPIASAVAARLRSEGYRVEVAPDGPAGIELCERVRPDLVVLDLMLPGLDG